MQSETFVQLVIGIIMVMSALITTYALPLIQTKIEASKLQQELEKIKELYNYAKSAVQWANQTIPSEQWEKKKHEVFESVKKFMLEKLNINLSDEQLEKIIEAFVIECKKENR